MRGKFTVAMARTLGWSASLMAALAVFPQLAAQTGAGDDAKKPAAVTQPAAESNPFPEDTSTVPVMPTTVSPDIPEGSSNGSGNESGSGPGTGRMTLPADDSDPIRSPDDAALPAAGNAEGDTAGWSSSLSGNESLLPQPDSDQRGKKHKTVEVKAKTHQQEAAEDVEVGGYYLQTKDWKGALSRFESALVLDPENPDVYWGLAEADFHLGKFFEARGYYEKVAEYDPDSRHGKDARKALKSSEIANAKSDPSKADGAK